MNCSELAGHPQYPDGRGEDQEFLPCEKLYRRYTTEHYQGGQLLPDHFSLRRPSFNREKFSSPEDILHADCCGGRSLDDWGVLELALREVPTPIEGADHRIFYFSPAHRPLPCCYAHSEIWCRVDGQQIEQPSPKVRETFRVMLSKKMTIRIPARA